MVFPEKPGNKQIRADSQTSPPNDFDSCSQMAIFYARFGDTAPMAKMTVNDLNVRGKHVCVRVDYNVPLEEKDGRMVITDATRIVETLPTLRLLIEQGGK